MTEDTNVRRLQLDIAKHQRRHEHIAHHLAEVVIRSGLRQKVIDRLDSKLLGIYRLVALDERDPEARLAIIGQIIEETLPRKVAVWRERRELPALEERPPKFFHGSAVVNDDLGAVRDGSD